MKSLFDKEELDAMMTDLVNAGNGNRTNEYEELMKKRKENSLKQKVINFISGSKKDETA